MAIDSTKQMWIILRALDKTKKAFSSMDENVKKSETIAKKAFSAMKAGAIGFIFAVGTTAVIAMKKLIDVTMGLVKSAVETAGEFEALELQFGVLLGSAEKGKAVFTELWDTARQLPYTITEIANSAKQLTAWGVVGNDITIVMKGLADATALTGQSMDVMARVIGRAWQMGTFYARGPGALLRGLMQDKMNIDVTKLSLIEFRKALVDLVTDPKYGVAGMAVKLAGTFRGIKSMISDAMTDIKLTIAGTGLFDEVKLAMQDILFILRDPKIKQALSGIGTVARDIVRTFRTTLADMFRGGELIKLIRSWVANVGRWGKILMSFIKNLPQITTVVMNLVTSMSGAFTMFFQNLNEVINLLSKLGIGTSLQDEMEAVTKKGKAVKKELQEIKFAVAEAEQGFRNLASGAGDIFERTVEIKGKMVIVDQLELERMKEKRDELQKQFDGYKQQAVALLKRQEFFEKSIMLEGLFKDSVKLSNKELKALNKTVDDLASNLLKAHKAFAEGVAPIQTLTEEWNAFLDQVEVGWGKFGDIAKETAEIMEGSFSNLFFDVMTGQIKSIGEYMMSFWGDIARALSKRMAEELVMKFMPITGGGGSSTGGLITSIASAGVSASKDVGGVIMPALDKRGIIDVPKMSSPSGGMEKSVNVNITAMDSDDVYRTLEKNQSAFGAFFQNQVLTNQRGVRR